MVGQVAQLAVQKAGEPLRRVRRRLTVAMEDGHVAVQVGLGHHVLLSWEGSAGFDAATLSSLRYLACAAS